MLLRFLTSIILIYDLKNGNISKAISFNKGFMDGLWSDIFYINV